MKDFWTFIFPFCVCTTYAVSMYVQSTRQIISRVKQGWTNNCFIQTVVFTRFKRRTLLGIRADQASAQKTTRLTVTSKHYGLSPNCLPKIDNSKERQWNSGYPPHALTEAVLQS